MNAFNLQRSPAQPTPGHFPSVQGYKPRDNRVPEVLVGEGRAHPPPRPHWKLKRRLLVGPRRTAPSAVDPGFINEGGEIYISRFVKGENAFFLIFGATSGQTEGVDMVILHPDKRKLVARRERPPPDPPLHLDDSKNMSKACSFLWNKDGL